MAASSSAKPVAWSAGRTPSNSPNSSHSISAKVAPKRRLRSITCSNTITSLARDFANRFVRWGSTSCSTVYTAASARMSFWPALLGISGRATVMPAASAIDSQVARSPT
ncbi:unannotated protein [freshwater metagenome]|uniref:Unannotated protein n=1 Tax=freshwater metagenome TaxID=449393 RepID=A0A6J7QCJ8_9ZZZZ